MNARVLCAALFFLCLAGGTKAFAEEDLQFLLELWVNDSSKHIVAVITEHDNALLVRAEDLARVGIKTSENEIRADGTVDIYTLSGVNIELSDIEQKLLLTVSSQRLIPQAFDLKPEIKTTATQQSSGFLGRYDVSGTVDNFHEKRTSAAGAVIGGTFFSPQGNVTANGFTQTQGGNTQTIRLDTTAEIDEPDSLRRWIAGDAISGSRNWSRSVRFAGLQLATDFSLRPDLNTMPLPAFFGQTDVPANVDVFVNSARVFGGGVDPGPFEINNLPVITGNGEASVVVRDVLGRETTILLPFYASQSLLKSGLVSYDANIGVLRQAYGEENFAYGDLVSSASYSEGITNWLTLETHGEAAKDVQLLGGGGIFSIAPFGIVHPAVAVSRSDNLSDDGLGKLYSLSFESQLRPVGFFGSLSTTRGNYNDIASMDGSPPPEFQMQVGSNVGLGEYGAVAGSLIGMKRKDDDISRIATASYTMSLGAGYNFGATGFYDHTRGEFITQAFFNISLGGGFLGSANVQHSRDANFQQAMLTKPANPDGGVGYRLSTSAGDSSITEADATWIASRGTLDASLASRDGEPAARVSASGGMVVMDGSVYATRQPNGAVALIRTGKAGTGIYQENRQVATADENGEAMLTNLVPYAGNRVSIDPSNYSFSTIVEDTEKTISPPRASGVVVDFTPTPRFPAMIILRLGNDTFPPAGARVTLNNGGAPLIVGHRGQLFIPDLQGAVEGKVDYGTASCLFDTIAPAPLPSGAIPRLDPIYCLEDEAL